MRRLQSEWRRVYARRVVEARGEWVVDGWDWNVFRYGYAPSIDGWAALEEVERVLPSPVVLLSAAGTERLWAVEARLQRVRSASAVEDQIGCPRDFSWTLLVSHEEGAGPYYSSEEWLV